MNLVKELLANMSIEESEALSDVADFISEYWKMPPDVRMKLIEKYDSLNQRNFETIITCFEISLMSAGISPVMVEMFMGFMESMIALMVLKKVRESVEKMG